MQHPVPEGIPHTKNDNRLVRDGGTEGKIGSTGVIRRGAGLDQLVNVVRIMLSGGSDLGTATAAINEGEVHKFFVKGQDAEWLRREIKRKI